MTRPPTTPSDLPGQRDTQDNLVELPVTCPPRPAQGARLAEEPSAIAAWVEHAQDDQALADRLAELARELAEGPPAQQAVPRSRPWIAVGLVAAAALITMAVLGSYALRAPSPQPTVQPQPIAVPTVVPLPAPLPEPPPIAVVELQPQPSPPPPTPPAPKAARVFESSDPSKPIQLMAGVEVLLNGSLELTGSSRAPRLSLVGSAVIDVVPGSVDSLQVDSNAALVKVLGTRFAVTEGGQDTTVSVERGRVAVSCRAGQQATLAANEQQVCLNANGLFLEAKRLQGQGAPAQDVLPVVQAALGFPDFALHDRLEAMQAKLLSQLAHPAAAEDDSQDTTSSL